MFKDREKRSLGLCNLRNDATRSIEMGEKKSDDISL